MTKQRNACVPSRWKTSPGEHYHLNCKGGWLPPLPPRPDLPACPECWLAGPRLTPGRAGAGCQGLPLSPSRASDLSRAGACAGGGPGSG